MRRAGLPYSVPAYFNATLGGAPGYTTRKTPKGQPLTRTSQRMGSQEIIGRVGWETDADTVDLMSQSRTEQQS
jgi:hypothetical protein